MPGEDGVGQVIEAFAAVLALVSLAVGLGVVATILDDRSGTAGRTGDAVGPTHVADGLETLGIVEEILDVHHGGRLAVPMAVKVVQDLQS